MLKLVDLLSLLLFNSGQLLLEQVNGGVVSLDFRGNLGDVVVVVMMFGVVVLMSLLDQSLVLGSILRHVGSHVVGSILGGCDVLLHG